MFGFMVNPALENLSDFNIRPLIWDEVGWYPLPIKQSNLWLRDTGKSS